MDNYNALARLPAVDMGQIKNIDLASIDRNALAATMDDTRLREAQYAQGGRQAYDEALQARGGNALAALGDVTAKGMGSYAQDRAGQATQNVLANVNLQEKTRDTAMRLLQAAQTEDDKNAILDDWERQTGQLVPQQYRQAPLQQLKQASFVMLTSPETRERMRLAQNADQRQADENARAAELQPGRVALQGAQVDYYGAKADRAQTQKPIMVEQPDPTDWTGKRKLKVPHMMQQNEDGSVSLVPVFTPSWSRLVNGTTFETKGFSRSMSEGGQATGQPDTPKGVCPVCPALCLPDKGDMSGECPVCPATPGAQRSLAKTASPLSASSA